MNEEIEKIFNNFKVNNTEIPVAFLKYRGKKEQYVTYQEIEMNAILCGDDEIKSYGIYYDFDIYSKGNYLKIVKEIKKILKKEGFMWVPNMSSGDMFEDETGYYHKTLCFYKEKEE